MRLSLQGVFVFLTSAGLAAQIPMPGPDFLGGDGEADLIRRLSDRNGNGIYNIPNGEAYDYAVTTNQDSSFRTIKVLNGRIYTCDTIQEAVWMGSDANSDGTLGFNTELTKAFDWPGTYDPDPSLLDLTSDGTALWVTNNRGSNEGIFRMQDLTGDGDFEDPGEVRLAVGEPTASSITLGNIPFNTNPLGATISVTNFQSISFDPTTSPGSLATGRLLVEHETNEAIVSFEDKNGDGDFWDAGSNDGDAGEVNLFLLLAPLDSADLPNPNAQDVSAAWANLPIEYQISFTEIEHVLVDTTGAQPIYYISSEEDSLAPQRTIVFRGVDNNSDGDINDAGEITVYFDGSSDSTLGATTEYADLYGVGLGLNGSDVYLSLQHFSGGINDADHVVLLDDVNGNNVIDQASEVHVVFSMTESRLYNLTAVAPASLPLPTGTVGYYTYLDRSSCLSSQSLPGSDVLHTLTIGSDNFDEKLVVGNTVGFNSTGVAISTLAALHIGSTFPGPIPLDLGGLCNVFVNPIIAIGGLITDGGGSLALPIPVTAGIVGFGLNFQTVAIDFGINPFNVTTSNTVFAQFGDYSFTQASLH